MVLVCPLAVVPERIQVLYQIMVDRARNWAFIAYPDSMPDNWVEVLSDFHIPAFVSPLHDKDVDADGGIKKAHYHIMLMYQGKKSMEQVQGVSSALNGTRVVSVSDKRGYGRYLCHLDEVDEKKYHYDKSGVLEIAGACYDDTIQLPSDTDEIIRQIEMYIAENDVVYYSDFSLWLALNKPEWHKVFKSHTIHFSAILRSIDYKRRTQGDATVG